MTRRKHACPLEEQRRGQPLLPIETVLFHLPPERDGADLERLGSLLAIAAIAIERTVDERALLGLEVETVIRLLRTRALRDLRRQLAQLDTRAGRHDDGPLDGVLE